MGKKIGMSALLPAVALLLLLGGCRQAPKDPPKYYEAELRAMEREAAQQQAAKHTRFLEDRYPWEGKKPVKPSLPCRIAEKEKILNSELDYLHTFVRGRKRYKPRLRD